MKKNTKKKLALKTKIIAEQNQKLIQGGTRTQVGVEVGLTDLCNSEVPTHCCC